MAAAPNPLSIHAYVYLPAWSTAGAAQALPRAAAAGYQRMVVPLRDFAAIDPPAIARLFEQAGLQPSNSANLLPDADLSSPDPDVRARGLARLRQSLRLARDMGSTHVGGVLYGVLRKHERAASPAQWQWAADSLATLGEEARGMGIRLALEIVNRYESNLVNTVAQGLALLAAIGSDNVFLHLDTFHLHIEEADPLQALRAALPRLAYLELDQNHRGRPDQGAIDFGPWLACAVAGGYRGPIGIEAFSASVIGPEIGGAIGIWRDLFQDGDEVARSGIAAIRHGLTQARLP
mgnify:CR=1 FL=1